MSDDFGDLSWPSGTMWVFLMKTEDSTKEYHSREMMTEVCFIYFQCASKVWDRHKIWRSGIYLNRSTI